MPQHVESQHGEPRPVETRNGDHDGDRPVASMVDGEASLVAAGAGPLLDQVCGTALRLLADTPRPLRSLQVRAGEVSVRVEWAAPAAPAPDAPAPGTPAPGALAAAPAPAAEPEPSGGYITAQTVGVFYHAPEPGAAPFVREGDTVSAGQQVGIIEAMKLMIPVEADRAGRIAAVLTENADPVEYGDRLFALASVDPA